MNLNIGSQHAGQINNVAGNQTIYGDQVATITSTAEALAAVQEIYNNVEKAGISRQDRIAARQDLEHIDRDLRQPQPDKPSIGQRLTRLTHLLISAGALITSGTSLVALITNLATWLGPFGTAALNLLTSPDGARP